MELFSWLLLLDPFFKHGEPDFCRESEKTGSIYACKTVAYLGIEFQGSGIFLLGVKARHFPSLFPAMTLEEVHELFSESTVRMCGVYDKRV